MSSEDTDIEEDLAAAPVERVYQIKSQLQQILVRPDTYVGSVEFVTQNMWVYDGEEVGLVHREVSFVPGLLKIFDEILVNATDNKVRDKKMDCMKITIDPESNMIKVWNNGAGIPVEKHKDAKMYVPALIFGHFFSSSSYNDEEPKVTGGRNGYGAKLCNVFSKKFVVETATKVNKKCFKQMWTENMSETTEPVIRNYSGREDYTCITFYPDLERFKMEKLDKDILALMFKRAYDITATTKGIKVYLNSKKLPICSFQKYVQQYLKDKEDETGKPLKCVYEASGERWEVAVSLSVDRVFKQVSFVNNVATFKGGRHVDYVTDQIIPKIIQQLTKKKKKGCAQVEPSDVKKHIWLFVNCKIVNPAFDSQTKENMTLESKSFGSECILSDKFMARVLKSGIIESVLSSTKFKAENQLNNTNSANKISKLEGVPKCDDAFDAGTENSINCTLILTEGDSAKALAVSGLSVIGRAVYGIYPLKGKLLNVRKANRKQILENPDLNNIVKILGLRYNKKYETIDDLNELRYGKLLIMTDQDQDGSYIKGLLINFFHHNWPSLLKLPFLEEFRTQIVKAFKGSQELKFYSIPEFEEWKTKEADWNKWTVKYYEGLAMSTKKEAREYFADMVNHRIKFHYEGIEDDNAIELAFSKNNIEQRKEWLTAGMRERKRRRELGLPETCIYGNKENAITYNSFINKEYILFCNMDNEQSIPSVVDGLKPGQREVIFTCIKRKDDKEVKVNKLAGSVAVHSAYHLGEQTLTTTILNLAHDFVGSNNINLLMPIGQFGTRLEGGKDAGKSHYISTKLSPLAKLIFNPLDEPLLNQLRDEGRIIEPEYYVPIIPTVLVNGAEGIGTGWSTKIPNYNPRVVVHNIRRLLRGEEQIPMKPWYKNFRGTIEAIEASHFVTSGEVAILGPGTIEITELPIKTWTQPYKESVLDPMAREDENTPAQITGYKNYSTDITVRFEVEMAENTLSQYKEEGLHKIFKLQSPISLGSMVLFDSNGVLKRYDSPEEILLEFFTLRLDFYVKRKEYLEGKLEAEARKLTNQARFVLERISGKFVVEAIKMETIVDNLIDFKYDSDPVKTWEKMQLAKLRDDANENEEIGAGQATNGRDFSYLLNMSHCSLSLEKKDDLLEEKAAKIRELQELIKKTPQNLWNDDLDLFVEELNNTEAREEIRAIRVKDIFPSNLGERVVPIIDEKTRRRVEKTVEVKKRKAEKNKEKDGDDEAEPPKKKRCNKKGVKTKVKPAPKTKSSTKKRTECSDSESLTPPRPKRRFLWSGSLDSLNDSLEPAKTFCNSDSEDIFEMYESPVSPVVQSAGPKVKTAGIEFISDSDETPSVSPPETLGGTSRAKKYSPNTRGKGVVLSNLKSVAITLGGYKVPNGIVLSWNMMVSLTHAEIVSYQLYALSRNECPTDDVPLEESWGRESVAAPHGLHFNSVYRR